MKKIVESLIVIDHAGYTLKYWLQVASINTVVLDNKG